MKVFPPHFVYGTLGHEPGTIRKDSWHLTCWCDKLQLIELPVIERFEKKANLIVNCRFLGINLDSLEVRIMIIYYNA